MEIREAIIHARQVAKDCDGNRDCKYQHDQLADWLEELSVFKDAEEQNRLVILPCKIGDTVYGSLYDCVNCPLGRNISIEEDICKDCQYGVVSDLQFKISDLQFLNKTVFLTREEAEEALRRTERETY